MNYSDFHINLAFQLNFYRHINKQDVLENPKKYLGSNYKEVLNWWFYRESFTWVQKEIIKERAKKIDDEVWNKAYHLSKKLASEVIDPRFVYFLAVVERELVAAHLYIQQNIPFTYIPLIFDL
jgi:hypothetical protein